MSTTTRIGHQTAAPGQTNPTPVQQEASTNSNHDLAVAQRTQARATGSTSVKGAATATRRLESGTDQNPRTPTNPDVPARHAQRRRHLARFAVALAAVVAPLFVTVGTAAPASALTICMTDNCGPSYQYYGKQRYWYSPYRQYYWVDVWILGTGGGTVYCWAGTNTCWYEQWPWRLR